MALKDFTLGKRNRIAVGGVTAVGLIIYGVSNLIAPAYRVDNTEGERLFEISTHGALGTGTGNAFGTIGQVLTSGGGSGKLMSWTTVPTIAGAGAGADADARYVNVAGDTMTGALAIKVTSGTSTGNTLVVDTNGLVYDATNKRVGIGTTSPLRKFQVEDTGNAFAAVYKNAATPSSFLLAAEGAQNRIYSWTTPTNSSDKPLYIQWVPMMSLSLILILTSLCQKTTNNSRWEQQELQTIIRCLMERIRSLTQVENLFSMEVISE